MCVLHNSSIFNIYSTLFAVHSLHLRNSDPTPTHILILIKLLDLILLIIKPPNLILLNYSLPNFLISTPSSIELMNRP